MNIVKKLCIIFLLPLFLFGKKERINSNYISLDFAYDHYEVPIPRIIFNIDSFSTDALSFVGYKFRITTQDFLAIEKIVKAQSPYIILDSLAAVRYYDISIVRSGKKTTYGTVNLRYSKELFNKIVSYFQGSKKHSEISKAFEYINSQLKPI